MVLRSTNSFYNSLLANGNCVSTSATIVKKDILKKDKILFDEKKQFITAEDYDFFKKLQKKGINLNF